MTDKCPECGWNLCEVPGGFNCLTRQRAAATEARERVQDDGLADRVAGDCGDSHHDDRWCPTCEARRAGIEAYRQRVRGATAAPEAAVQEGETPDA